MGDFWPGGEHVSDDAQKTLAAQVRSGLPPH